MKKKNLLYGILLLLIVACGGAEAIADLFVANLSNDFTSSRSSSFIFSPAKTGVNESDFTGQELDASGVDKEFSGHFLNYDIHFTFTSGPEKDVTYTGKFVKGSDPETIKLTGSNGQPLTLIKHIQP
jgi:phosphoheptose isomerase